MPLLHRLDIDMSDIDQPTPDERPGMTWWNNLTDAGRRDWMRCAGDTGRVADAWALCQRKGKQLN